MDLVSRMLDMETWCGDIDMGEMFLNFPLDTAIRPYVGIELEVNVEGGNTEKWRGRWCRTQIGFKPSLYLCVKSFLYQRKVIRGDRRDPRNLFRWDQ
eukprot:5079856-Ditylum_brightwellii.AAC.1